MDGAETPTCLNPDPHEKNIKDHILHYLGCVKISDRNKFLQTPAYVLSDEEIGATSTTARPNGSQPNKVIDKRKEAWRENCLSELRRIAFLRSKLEEDEEEKHLVDNIKNSRRAWEESEQYSIGIAEIEKWEFNSKPFNKIDIDPKVVGPYEPGRDVTTPFMLFKKQDDANSVYEPDEEKVDPKNSIWGKFPNQKTNVQRLLVDKEDIEHGKRNLLDGRGDDERIRYFHIPSNNMLMPYLHWETSRNQQRFSQIIENIVDNKKREDRQTQKVARKLRQVDRETLTKPKRPIPVDSRTYWDKIQEYSQELSRIISATNPDDATSAHGHRKPQLHFGPIRSMTQLLRAQAVKEKLNLSGQYPQVDKNGRVDLETWLEKQRKPEKKRSWFRPLKKQGTDSGYRLGQYLIDAARLFEAMTSYRDRKLLETYLMKDPPMHPRRTLDQAYYWSINNTNHRDLDQVVYRATTADPIKFHRWNVDRSIWAGHNHEENKTPKELEELKHEPCSECTANIQKVSRVIMVDQLWMWVLDKKTIITCFPKRYGANKHDTSGIHKSIRMRIEEGGIRIRSVFDLALVIFEECSNTFFDRTRTADKQPQVLDEFSEAIGNIMHQQTDAFEKLWRWTERASKMYRRLPGAGVLSQLHIPLLDINPEGKLEKEIKDIVEELGIMSYIKKAEKDVLQSFVDNARQVLRPEETGEVSLRPQTPGGAKLDGYFSTQRGYESRSRTSSPAKGSRPFHRSKEVEEARAAYDWFCNNALELLKRVDQRIAQLEELARSAKSTAEMVKDLLELKQQQAGVVQAWQSVEYSNEAMRQGRSILVFTIVTIVFLPLSFMSSVFGMNAIELGGGDNVMHLRDQFTYIFSISVGVIVLTLLFSISTSFRTFLWCIFKQSYTTVLVWTGVYRNIYLKMNLTTDDMYENAVKKTENLKAKEKEKFLKSRHQRKELEGRKKQALAERNEDDPNSKGNGWKGWARSLFRPISAHGSADDRHQNNSGELGASQV
ncbi:hypothetical protein KVR01_007579 [Diaporthe batatas]|uniref:uncharacterized protein n=1 Tax=Diaporthe batatas TaxID=748121 RepID=UPI001D05172B|nr:uncharacterized protein KVR01_007579 [Diaporthe batatas]KAG8163101.1 hypothetical protein KVR01_007579 [Diaporthe batatas]